MKNILMILSAIFTFAIIGMIVWFCLTSARDNAVQKNETVQETQQETQDEVAKEKVISEPDTEQNLDNKEVKFSTVKNADDKPMYAYLKLSKDEVENLTSKDVEKIYENFIKDKGYNWFSITDGEKGVMFTNCMPIGQIGDVSEENSYKLSHSTGECFKRTDKKWCKIKFE